VGAGYVGILSIELHSIIRRSLIRLRGSTTANTPEGVRFADAGAAASV
jgi:hypothetical protein